MKKAIKDQPNDKHIKTYAETIQYFDEQIIKAEQNNDQSHKEFLIEYKQKYIASHKQ